MPSVQTAFGPIVEPGWPSTLPKPDIADKFVAGAALGAQMNLKRQNLERQLQELALKNQNLEFQHYNDTRNFLLKQSLGEERNDIARQRMEGWREQALMSNERLNQELALHQREQDRKEQNADMKWMQEDAKYRAAQIPYELDKEGVERGTAEWLKRYNEKRSGIYGLPNAVSTAIDRNAFNAYNVDAERARKAEIDKEKAYYRDVQDKVWGDGITTDLNPIFHPEQYDKELKGTYGFRKPTGNIIIGKVKTPSGEVKKRVINPSVLTEMNKRWYELEAEKQKIGKPVIDPHVGVYPGRPETDQEKATRILRDTTNDERTQLAAKALIDPEATQAEKNQARIILQGR